MTHLLFYYLILFVYKSLNSNFSMAKTTGDCKKQPNKCVYNNEIKLDKIEMNSPTKTTVIRSKKYKLEQKFGEFQYFSYSKVSKIHSSTHATLIWSSTL